MPSVQLAPNFTLAELSRTSVSRFAAENAREAAKEPVLARLREVAAMLQVLRDHYQAPVFVHSGFRCPRLNAAIGGSATSQHKLGEAADFHVHGVDLEAVWTWLWQEAPVDFGQCILEGHAPGEWTWIHLSLGPPFRSREKSGEVMTFDGAQYRKVARKVWPPG